MVINAYSLANMNNQELRIIANSPSIMQSYVGSQVRNEMDRRASSGIGRYQTAATTISPHDPLNALPGVQGPMMAPTPGRKPAPPLHDAPLQPPPPSGIGGLMNRAGEGIDSLMQSPTMQQMMAPAPDDPSAVEPWPVRRFMQGVENIGGFLEDAWSTIEEESPRFYRRQEMLPSGRSQESVVLRHPELPDGEVEVGEDDIRELGVVAAGGLQAASEWFKDSAIGDMLAQNFEAMGRSMPIYTTELDENGFPVAVERPIASMLAQPFGGRDAEEQVPEEETEDAAPDEAPEQQTPRESAEEILAAAESGRADQANLVARAAMGAEEEAPDVPKWAMPLVVAGLTMMQTTGTLGQAIGEGGLAGIGYANAEQTRALEARQAEVDMEYKQALSEAARAQAALYSTQAATTSAGGTNQLKNFNALMAMGVAPMEALRRAGLEDPALTSAIEGYIGGMAAIQDTPSELVANMNAIITEFYGLGRGSGGGGGSGVTVVTMEDLE